MSNEAIIQFQSILMLIMRVEGMQLLAVSLLIYICVGYAKPPSKIVNGRNAGSGEFPHQVSLQVWKQHFCGGSILDATHILTAAHCVFEDDGKIVQNMEVVTGVLDNWNRSANNVFPVAQVIYHHNYSPKDSWRNDIAVLKLTRAISFNAHQKPIALPKSDTPDGAAVTASGWGAAIYAGARSQSLRYLQKLTMLVVSLQRCRQTMGNQIQSGQICAASVSARGGICVGDSGGPLTYNTTVIGIASFVNPCAHGLPDVFTRVYHYSTWINYVLETY